MPGSKSRAFLFYKNQYSGKDSPHLYFAGPPSVPLQAKIAMPSDAGPGLMANILNVTLIKATTFNGRAFRFYFIKFT
jgi:hypothetical protein